MSQFGHVGAIAGRFALNGEVREVEPMPGGHINDSYRVTVAAPDGTPAWYLLQHVNPDVFTNASQVMENISYVTRHLAAQRRAGRTRREALALIPTTSGGAWTEDSSRSCWRMYVFITGTHVRERPQSPAEVREAARAFGEFLFLLADYSGPPLHETIRGFHDSAARLERFRAAVAGDVVHRVAHVALEIEAILAQADLVKVLPPFLANGEVPLRIVHNDAKLANVLLDDATGIARCVVDLDTVMPGSILHDFGDMVRSMTTPTDEDETDLDAIRVHIPLFEAVAEGFLESAGPMLTPRERTLLIHAGRLITYEQAIRFLTDYVEGDRYYRVNAPDQNLRRARAQLRLLETLCAHAGDLEAIVARLTP